MRTIGRVGIEPRTSFAKGKLIVASGEAERQAGRRCPINLVSVGEFVVLDKNVVRIELVAGPLITTARVLGQFENDEIIGVAMGDGSVVAFDHAPPSEIARQVVRGDALEALQRVLEAARVSVVGVFRTLECVN